MTYISTLMVLLLGLRFMTLLSQDISTYLLSQHKDMAEKGYLAAVEQSGDVSGDYAQFEESTFDDLKDRGKLPANMTWEEVKSNPAKYDMVVDTYWNDLTDTFGIPDDPHTKAIWWLMPGRYKKTGGDIEKLESEAHRNIMRNRVINLDAFIRGG